MKKKQLKKAKLEEDFIEADWGDEVFEEVLDETPQIRKFDNGALRDTGNGKYDYYGFRHPLLEQSFAKYMHEHRKMADGSLRDADNWWKGWDKLISLQSMIRHLEDLQALQAGYFVFEIRDKGNVRKLYTKELAIPDGDFKQITEEDCCNAIRFNAMAYLKQIIDKTE